jgi:hypothetical protein
LGIDLMRTYKLAAAASALALMTGAAQAAPALLTSSAGYTGPSLDLSAYQNGSYNFTAGPVPVGPFTFTSTNSTAVVGQGSYGLSGNGNVGGSAVYLGLNTGTGSMQVLGSTAFSQIGFFFNYAPGDGADPIISTLNAAGAVIDSWNLATLAPISTPGGFNQFVFRGVSHDSADIYGLRMGGSYIVAAGTATGALAATSAVPEPATWAMMIGGFAMVGAGMRMRRRKAALA